MMKRFLFYFLAVTVLLLFVSALEGGYKSPETILRGDSIGAPIASHFGFNIENPHRRQKRASPVRTFPDRNYTVTVYEHANYGGASMSFQLQENGCVTWGPSEWWNDNVTMVALHGYCVRAWSYQDCSGHSVCLCTVTTDLRTKMMTQRRTWDDEITSFSGCGYRGYQAQIMLYEQRNFQGASRKFILGTNECVSLFQGEDWNDRASSANVTTGCVQFFTDVFCQGLSYKLRGTIGYVGDSFDKEISSFRPC